MAVMDGPDRRKLVETLEAWLENAKAGVQCTSPPMPPGTIALIVAPSDSHDAASPP